MGDIETSGVEFAATVQVSGRTSFYSAFTFNDSEYIGSGDPLVDANQGILAGIDVTGVPARLWVLSLDRSGPFGGGLMTPAVNLPRREWLEKAIAPPGRTTRLSITTVPRSHRVGSPAFQARGCVKRPADEGSLDRCAGGRRAGERIGAGAQ